MNTENNKIIAGFMGMKYSEERSFNNGEWTHSIRSLNKFKTSWDWLMVVVEKIENLEYIDRMGRFNVNAINFEENYTCVITDKENNFIQEEGESKISATYNACVEFINWYNNQKN